MLPERWAVLLTGWIAFYAMFGQRVFLPVDAGRALPLANVVTIALAIVLLATHARLLREVLDRFARMLWLVAFVSVWTVLSLAGPITGYPPYTVFSVTAPLAVAAFVAIGSLLTEQRTFSQRALVRSLMVVVWAQFVVGLMQAFWYTRILQTPLQRWLYLWDTWTATAYGVELIAGRSVGLYLNPNTYSLLGALILVLALTLPLSSWHRTLLSVPAIGIVALGASRGAVLALLLVLTPIAVARLGSMKPALAAKLLGGTLATLLALHLALLSFGGSLYSRVVTRWSTIPTLIAQGSSADANAAGRFTAWGRALAYWQEHPLGSFGPPQMAVSSFTDNDYVTLLLQGGILLLASYIGVLVSTLVRRRSSLIGPSVAPVTGLIALTGMTQTSAILVPAFAVFWPIVGSVLGPVTVFTRSQVANRAEARRIGRLRHGRRRAVAILVGSSIVLVLVALAVRVSGTGYDPATLPRQWATRPPLSVDATATLPGVRISDEPLGAYYLEIPGSEVRDLSAPETTEAEDHRLSQEWAPARESLTGRDLAAPVAVATIALNDYTRYIATGDRRFLDFAKRGADWLIQEQGSDGAWRYPYSFYDLPEGWVSANVQSKGISLLARLYQDTEDDKYVDAARKAYIFMMTPLNDGGTLSSFDDGAPVLEGYARSRTARHALNGALSGVLSLHDLAVVTGDARVHRQFVELATALSDHLDDYDLDGWSRYSLGLLSGPAPHLHHRLHISGLQVMSHLTDEGDFDVYARRWELGLQEWVEESTAAR